MGFGWGFITFHNAVSVPVTWTWFAKATWNCLIVYLMSFEGDAPEPFTPPGVFAEQLLTPAAGSTISRKEVHLCLAARWADLPRVGLNLQGDIMKNLQTGS